MVSKNLTKNVEKVYGKMKVHLLSLQKKWDNLLILNIHMLHMIIIILKLNGGF